MDYETVKDENPANSMSLQLKEIVDKLNPGVQRMRGLRFSATQSRGPIELQMKTKDFNLQSMNIKLSKK